MDFELIRGRNVVHNFAPAIGRYDDVIQRATDWLTDRFIHSLIRYDVLIDIAQIHRVRDRSECGWSRQKLSTRIITF